MRAHLEAAARAGHVPSQELLYDGPECPPSMRYFLELLGRLHGRSGVTMNGVAPLSWPTLDAMTRLTGIEIDGEDIDALFLADAVMLNPGELQVG